MKQPLIFLHGALGCKSHWERFLGPFIDHYEVHNINFPGHGDSNETLPEYSCDALADFLHRYIAEHHLKNCIIVGYSMGGYVGLNLAVRQSGLFHSLITLATKLNWSMETAATESDKLTEESLLPILDKLKIEHGNNINGLRERTISILLSIGANPVLKTSFFNNTTPVSMLRGSKDRMVTEEETTTFAEGLPFFKTIELDNQPHLLERMDADIVCNAILQILKG